MLGFVNCVGFGGFGGLRTSFWHGVCGLGFCIWGVV